MMGNSCPYQLLERWRLEPDSRARFELELIRLLTVTDLFLEKLDARTERILETDAPLPLDGF